jgi:hypothetical protein
MPPHASCLARSLAGDYNISNIIGVGKGERLEDDRNASMAQVRMPKTRTDKTRALT